jgi:putative Holliday junction resolvase
MIITNFKDFPRNGRLMGIDWGARRIGTAVSTPDLGFVFPRGILTFAEIIKTIESEKIVGVVIGLPLHVDGTDSDTTKQVRQFAAQLESATDLPIAFIEENLTSVVAAERTHTRQSLDSESAAIILENAISVIKRKCNV